ncbi:MAG: TrkH family potassium uptake protein [Oscillospiraceae bacterium]|jgi:trk system potassium uptake protein TrkH|nr:TrkH family potassium uptake protein [Oscillospiraceae bacterium]
MKIITIFRIWRNGGFYSKILAFAALLIAVPVVVAPFYKDEWLEAVYFILSAVIVLAASVLSAVLSKERGTEKIAGRQHPLQESALPVLFTWLAAIAAGALPFILSGRLNVLHALFESVSGWTTTGLTHIPPESLPKIFLFHKAFMQYSGGLGFVILIGIAIGGRQMTGLYNAEGHPEGVMPNLRKTSRAIVLLYTSCLLIGSALYVLFGMPVFDAVCHAMSALSTAGSSTHSESIGYYNSVPIELVSMFLMLIGSVNFAVLLLFIRGKFRRAAKVSELRFLFCVIAVFVPLSLFSLAVHGGYKFLTALREAAFAVVSIVTSTGYSLGDYALWPAFVSGLLILLMILGGGTGSTSGGIKLLRAYILVRVTKTNISKRRLPEQRVLVLRYNRPQGSAPIDEALVHDTLEFITVYIGVLFAGTLLLTHFEDVTLMDALFEFTSALGTTGLSNGLTLRAGAGALIVEMFGMLLGRLEIFTVFIGLYAALGKLRGLRRSKSPRSSV